MNKPISKDLWVDRFALRVSQHDAGLSPDEVVERGDELWSSVADELSPEVAADMAVGTIEVLEHMFFHFED